MAADTDSVPGEDASAIGDAIARYLDERLLPPDTITAETDLLEADLLDSLLIMDIMTHVETVYGVKLDGGDIAPRNFRTPAALAALVSQRRS